MLIRLGHSPDPDDAFMFWGLASGEVDPREFEFEHVLKDIQTLNEWALEGRLEVFPGAGHFVALDEPQRFNEVLLEFLGQCRT